MQVSIIIPIIRPEKAKRCIESIKKNAGIPETQYEIITKEDHERIGCPRMVKRLLEKTNHDLVCFVGDDTVMEPGALKTALNEMSKFPGGWGLVAFEWDHPVKGHNNSAHFIIHKKCLDYLDGELFHTGYTHSYCDDEMRERLNEIGRYKYAMGAKVSHDHPAMGGDYDDDYSRVYQIDTVREDHKLFMTRKIEQGRQKYAIGFPIVESTVPVQFMVSFMLMSKPDYTLMLPKFPVGSFAGNIADARNSLVEQALKERCTHLFMLDTDQVYPVDCLEKLISHGKPVVGTPVHRRWPPFDPILYRGELGRYKHVSDAECYSGGLVPVDATGCGCILYDLRILFDIPSPWFELGKAPNGDFVGEDIMLCSKIRRNGVPIYVDTSIEIGHMTTYEVNRSTYELFKKLNDFKYMEAA